MLALIESSWLWVLSTWEQVPLLAKLTALGSLAGVIILVTSSIGLFQSWQQQVAYTASLTKNVTPIPLGKVTVAVSGAVENPGVYELPTGSRVGTAITQAGGTIPDQVDAELFDTKVNLADLLLDGQKIQIPFKKISKPDVAEAVAAATAQESPDASSGCEPVSLNTATQAELEALPEIGAKKATQIIAARPITNIDELISQKILSTNNRTNLDGCITL